MILDTYKAVHPTLHPQIKETALVILNQPIPLQHNFQQIWNKASVRIVADGGSNQLLKMDKEMKYIPDIICGDLDSIEAETKSMYSNMVYFEV